jgi:hypothetical protein
MEHIRAHSPPTRHCDGGPPGIIRKINAENPQENSGGGEALPAPDETGFPPRSAAEDVREGTPHRTWDMFARARKRVRRRCHSEVPPSHPRVPVIDSSDGRFIRKCFRVRRFGRLRISTRLG